LVLRLGMPLGQLFRNFLSTKSSHILDELPLLPSSAKLLAPNLSLAWVGRGFANHLEIIPKIVLDLVGFFAA
jgi:hypothetical protein